MVGDQIDKIVAVASAIAMSSVVMENHFQNGRVALAGVQVRHKRSLASATGVASSVMTIRIP